ncbi:MAG: cellulase family glycosylhydrolase, partial [Bacteroidetes bacterium]|nr:cellulase family glycosylhydrolase [Bacteroidota bacterium]
MSAYSIGFRSLITIPLLFLLIACSQDEANASVSPEPEKDTSSAKTASAVILSMGTGFNLGNTFDLAQNPTTIETIRPIIDLYYSAGLRHIRIPVTWREGFSGNTLANTSGTVNFQHPRFVQLKAVIDYALQKKMIVVLNTHHEHWLKDNYNGTPAHDSIFTALWRDIASYYKDYPYELVFELLNEPDGVFGDWTGGPTPNDQLALALTRHINYVGWKAVRETGGRNASRVIMLSTNGQGNQSQIEEVFPDKASLPGGGADRYLAIQVHTYDPWSFCGENGSNNAWPGTSALVSGVTKVAAHAKLLGVPINYGEFGVGRAANIAERTTDIVRSYYRTIHLAALNEGMSATFWDDRGWFGLIAKDGTGTYSFLFDIIPTVMA